MAKLKKKKEGIKNRIINFINEVKESPMDVLLGIFKNISFYIRTNIFFCLYVLFNLINAIMLRYITTNNVSNLYQLQPILADLAVILAFGAIGYLFKHRLRMFYLYFLTIIFTLVCVINSIYYFWYESYVSISLLSIAKYGEGVSDAIIDILRLKDFYYLIFPISLLFILVKLSKKKYFIEKECKRKEPKKALKTLMSAVVFGLLFMSTLSSTDISRISKQWNREYIVVKYGVYVYQINDIIKSVEPRISALFGYDDALKKFNNYFMDKPDEAETNKYTGVLDGKNILVIHAESIQTFVIGYELNGELVAPNLTKLSKDSIYFDNFYTQVSVGTSSDSEFTFNTGLMPVQNGTAFVGYFNRKYITTPSLLKERGYFNTSMHGNVASYWNRSTMHKSLGYDQMLGKSEYDIDEVIGLGLTDKSFFRQSIEKLKDIDSKHEHWYTTMIMLTNHTPFYVDDGYDVTLKEKVKENGKEVEKTYDYLEGTKLGRYLKSVHYADEALGELLDGLEKEGLLDNTAIVLYGDHDARLPKDEFQLMYNYDKENNKTLPRSDDNYVVFDSYEYELNRKTPFMIWTKESKIGKANMRKKISTVMGMYDVVPTLQNMLGLYNKYTFGHDMFSLTENDNIVVFPTGNWLTNKMYYNSQKGESYVIGDAIIPNEYIQERIKYAEQVISVSNNIVVYNLLDGVGEKNKDEVDESEIVEGA